LTAAELHAQTPREALFAHWAAVAERYGVLEPLTRSPKALHQAAELLEVHAIDTLRPAITAFWASPEFAAKRHFGMFAANAPQLVAHVASGAAHPFGAKVSAPRSTVIDPEVAAWVAGGAR